MNGYYLDEYPRLHCFNGKPKDNIGFFAKEFSCSKPSSDTKIYLLG